MKKNTIEDIEIINATGRAKMLAGALGFAFLALSLCSLAGCGTSAPAPAATPANSAHPPVALEELETRREMQALAEATALQERQRRVMADIEAMDRQMEIEHLERYRDARKAMKRRSMTRKLEQMERDMQAMEVMVDQDDLRAPVVQPTVTVQKAD